jgi:hypothetical protein
MENYENITIENEDVINPEVELEVYEEPEATSDEGGIGKVIAVGAAVVGGAVLLWKNRRKVTDWLDNRSVKKLEKKGYVISKPEDETESVEVCVEEDPVDEAE